MASRPRLTLVLFLLAWLAASAGLPKLQLDLSFRPLFASGAAQDHATREFEAIFGQASGAFATYIIEHEDVLQPQFVRALNHLSLAVGSVTGVDEVISLTTLRIPQWENGRLQLGSVIPTHALADDDILGPLLENLRTAGHPARRLLSSDNHYALVAVRLAPRMEDLQARREILDRLDDVFNANLPEASALYVTGVSVVEAAYEDLILRDQVIATGLTVLMLSLLLWLLFRQWRAVIACLIPVGMAVPAALGLMGWAGAPITIINSVIPAVILVVGVADAVHMVVAFLGSRQSGGRADLATSEMLATTGQACALTTLTTMAGFMALSAARLPVIRDFGIAVAGGVLVAWVANQILIPWLLRRVPLRAEPTRDRINRWIVGWIESATRLTITRPVAVITVSAVIVLLMLALVPRIDADQRFNEELPPGHPVRYAQELNEAQFGGFLGPEISVRRTDGGSMLDADTIARLTGLTRELQALPQTQSVSSVADLLPRNVVGGEAELALSAMRNAAELQYRVRERISPSADRLAILVRTGDLGTRRAAEYRDAVAKLSTEHFGPDYEIEIVGQWWMAQQGMRLVLGDMLRSLATALLVVIPILWLALSQWRLFIAALVANLVPLMLPLAFMAATGIRVRIGTAVVLAIALGIAVDNTLHIAARLRALSSEHSDPSAQVGIMMEGTGRAVIYTTIALIAGFLSMITNQLLAIRDMGLVAAVTFFGALLADLLLLPAIYVLLTRSRSLIAPADRRVLG
ncbi:MAG: MMPL family transporter [Pseudomonadales bacterium]